MRLWHKDLIPVLPRLQLLSLWRECCCVAKSISLYNTPNHILVNKIIDYPLSHFEAYSMWVYREMQNRGYKVNKNNFFKWFPYIDKQVITYQEMFSDWHSDRYLTQCYYNLQEKHDCGGISDEEWQQIEKFIQLRDIKRDIYWT